MIAIIDNFDSFTYNIYQILGELGAKVEVFRNDAISTQKLKELAPKKIIISPGPGYPDDAGISMEIIQEFYKNIPILGICLGHQSIVQVFGGKIIHAPAVMHGKTSVLQITNPCPLLQGIGAKPVVGRYHSLVADASNMPAVLRVTSQTEDGVIMSIHHVKYPLFGIQFHPESVLTPEGKRILANFIQLNSTKEAM